MTNRKETDPKEGKEVQKKSVLSKMVLVIIFLFLLILTGMISYTSVRFIYGQKYKKTNTQVEFDDEVLHDNLLTAIFLDDPDTPEVDYIALKNFNTNANKINVIMFPTDAVITLPKEIKKELESVGEDVEDEIYLTDIGSYYGSSIEKYEQTVKAMEDIFQEDIPSYETLDFRGFISFINLLPTMQYKLENKLYYYNIKGEMTIVKPGEVEIGGYKALGLVTFANKDERKKALKEEKSTRNTEPDPTTTTNNTNKTISTKSDSLDENGRIKASSNYLKKYIMRALDVSTREEMMSYLNSYYQLLSTNGNVSDITKYIDNFMALKEDSINFYTVKGKRKEDRYTIDSEKSAAALSNMMEEVKKEKNADEKDEKDSKTLDIEILNGAYIQGLAAEWKKKLEAEGFHIKEIGTFESEAIEDGLIIVSKEGMGKDLKKYLPDAKIQVGKIESGADIQIVLGRNNSIDEEDDEK